MINNTPISLATSIPRRKRGWDENISNKKSKLETVDAAVNLLEGSDENTLQEIHQSNLKRGIREANNSRHALGDITNTRINCIRKDVKRQKVEKETQEQEKVGIQYTQNKQKVAKMEKNVG